MFLHLEQIDSRLSRFAIGGKDFVDGVDDLSANGFGFSNDHVIADAGAVVNDVIDVGVAVSYTHLRAHETS